MAATSQPANDSARQLLRHTVSTLAYRAGKALRDVPESFATFPLLKIAESRRRYWRTWAILTGRFHRAGKAGMA